MVFFKRGMSRAFCVICIFLGTSSIGVAKAANVTCVLLGGSYDVQESGYVDYTNPLPPHQQLTDWVAGLGAPLLVAGLTLDFSGQPASIRWINRAGSGASSGIFTLDRSTGDIKWDKSFSRDLLGFIGQGQRIIEEYGLDFDCAVIGLTGELFTTLTWSDNAYSNWSYYQLSRGDPALPPAPPYLSGPWTPYNKTAISAPGSYSVMAANVIAIANWLVSEGKTVFVVLYPPASRIPMLDLRDPDFISAGEYNVNVSSYLSLLKFNGYTQWLPGNTNQLNYIDLWSNMTTRRDLVHPDAISVCNAGEKMTSAIVGTFHKRFPNNGVGYTTGLDCSDRTTFNIGVVQDPRIK